MALKAVFEPNFTPGERRILRHVCCVSTSVVCVNFDGCYVAAAPPASCMCVVPVTTVEGALKYFGMASEVITSREADILRERKKGSSTTII